MATKTPVTILEETCAKRVPREKPKFVDIVNEETSDPALRFIIKCTALGYSSIGRGVTKKAAKHNSAENLLRKFNSQGEAWTDDEDDGDVTKTSGNNSITDLYDYCVVKNLHVPSFRLIAECGPSHSPTFTFECSVDSIIREGKAGIKQIAKQNAAKEVLEILQMSYPDSEKKLVAVNEPTEMIRQKITSYHEAKKRNLTEKMGTSIKDRHQFFRIQDPEFTASVNSTLKSRQLSEHEKYEKLIAELELMQWNPKIESVETDLFKFDLTIEYEKYTCCLLNSNQDQLWSDVLQYFYDMMLINVPAQPFDMCDGKLDSITLEPL